MKIFKCETNAGFEHDTLYFSGACLSDAKKKLDNMCGEIPDDLITWTEVKTVPHGEEIL